MDLNSIPLPQLAASLAELTGQEPPPYRSLYLLVLNGELPAVLVRGRWHVDERRLPEIARLLGMLPPGVHRRHGSWGARPTAAQLAKDPEGTSRVSRRRPSAAA